LFLFDHSGKSPIPHLNVFGMKNKLNEVGASHMLKGSKEFFWHSPKGLCQEANFFHGSGLPPPLQKKGLPPESLCTDRAQ